MKARQFQILAVVAVLTAVPGVLNAQTPMGTAFTYQGYLSDGGVPADGPYDFLFTLFDGPDPGAPQIGDPVYKDGETVADGQFTVILDFGDVAFDGDARWLELAVRATGDPGAHTVLSPRQELTPTAYALVGADTLRIAGWPVDPNSPALDDVLKWDGLAWTPAADATGLYTAGDGLTLTGNEFSLDTAYTDALYVNEGQLDCISTTMLVDSAVTTGKIAAGAVTNSELANGAVTDAKVTDVAWTKITGAPSSLPPSGPAGGDLTGSYPDPTIGDQAVTTAKIANQAVTTARLADGAVTDAKVTDVAWGKITGAPSSFPPSGSAGGDLSGTYPNPTVAKLQGRNVSSTNPGLNQVLKWNGSAWAPATDNNTTYSAGSGLTLSGTTFNVGAGDGINVSSSAVSVDVSDFAGNGLGEDASNNLRVNTSTGLQISGDAVQLTSAYSSGTAYDSRFVNEGQSNSVTSAMIQGGAVAYSDLADPLSIGASDWDWDITSGEIDIDITSGYPAMNIESTCATYGDCLALHSSSSAGTSTWVLYSYTRNGNAGYFSKSTDDNMYALYVVSPGSGSEGLYVYGDTVATGTKSAAIETSEGQEAIFSVESPEVEIYASGSASLDAGRARVAFDRLFTEAVSPDVEIRVTVTPVGGWSALYIDSTDPRGFTIRSAAGDKDVRFHWMACGRRAGYESRPAVTIPDPQEQERIRQLKDQARAEQGAD